MSNTTPMTGQFYHKMHTGEYGYQREDGTLYLVTSHPTDEYTEVELGVVDKYGEDWIGDRLDGMEKIPSEEVPEPVHEKLKSKAGDL